MKVVKKIIFRALLYTAPVWLFYIYLEIRLGSMENSYSYKIKNFKAIQADCEILILGNSEILKGINPEFLSQPAYNMAHVSQSFKIDEKILEQFLPQMPKLKKVILGLSYISFGDDLQTGEENWRLYFYKKHYDLKFSNSFNFKNYSNTLRYNPYEALKICLNNFNTDLINGIQSNGWMKTEGHDLYHITDEFAGKRAMMHNQSLKTENVNANIESLRRIIAILKEKNIELQIVVPPVMKNYYLNLDTKWLAKNDSIITVLNREYNLRIIDFGKEDHGFNECIDCFNDADHLNMVGAEKFSRMIR